MIDTLGLVSKALSFSLQCQVEFGDQECVSLYNILFRRVLTSLRMVQMQRSYYEPECAMTVPQFK